MELLPGQVAVVTGAASGIGLAMAQRFAAEGLRVVLADVEEPALDKAVLGLRESGAEAVGVLTDVSERSSLDALADAAYGAFGAVHVLCNNAGIGIPTPTHNIRLDDWKWIIDVDLWGPIYGVKTFLPIMEEQGEGHINTTASLAGLIGGGFMGAYNVAKHGAVALMTTLERDLRGRKSPVRASVLCPGPINTDISRHSVSYRPSKAPPKASSAAEGKAGASVQALLDKGMDPDEVGRLVLDGIQRDTFWLLTHPSFSKVLTRQLDALIADGSLTKA
jgi:NAD(P)-dependent dehydrogenase (short-subunit alcohol dehydrogenase family)